MKQITIITSVLALSVIAFTAAAAVLKRKSRRKPTMTFRELLRDNCSANFLFSSEKERRPGDETT